MTTSGDAEQLINVVCRDLLGSAAQQEIFISIRVSSVYGVRLADGRDVVIKVHPTSGSLTRLRAVHRLQLKLADTGFPCPRPVIAPVSLPGHGPIAVEYMVTGGEPGRPRDPAHRRAMVEAFHWHTELLRDQPATAELLEPPGWADLRTRPGIWPAPHDPALRFEADPDASWIDDMAGAALAALRPFSEPVTIAHCDWESQNMRFDNARVHVVWDWDSLLAGRASCLIGFAAGCHTAQGRQGISDAPTVAEVSLFLDEYAEVSGRSWTTARRRAAAASALWLIAYNARIEHASAAADKPWSTALSIDYLHA